MFEAAELGRKIAKKEYRERVPALREALLTAQNELRSADFPVIVLFGGVDGAGKGDVVNALNAWLDPRWVLTHAFDHPTEEEDERPEYWRFWRTLPGKGQIGLLLSAWYSKPLLRRAYGGDAAEFDAALDEIITFEKLLADDGALIVKFWLHLGRKGQEKRFKRLEKDPLQSWRVTEQDWQHLRMYDAFAAAGEHIIVRTSTGDAPWHIVEGVDVRYASLRIADLLLEAIPKRLDEAKAETALRDSPPPPAVRVHAEPASEAEPPPEATQTVLSTLDMTRELPKVEYRKLLATHQGHLHQLQRRLQDHKISTILVFEGWDAGGKGGAIRRINSALDSRRVKVIPIAAPTDEERAHHYLWRFWRHVPAAGRVAIFDRSWYGRVLVERVAGFATEKEWRRAFAEINLFEEQLVRHGIVLLKFFMHITQDEQLRRFRQREQTPYKRWKLTQEDWRNREHWRDYEVAVHDMVERTSIDIAPWILVEANHKPFARVKVLEKICAAMEARLEGP